jgi:hypothetical protein
MRRMRRLIKEISGRGHRESIREFSTFNLRRYASYQPGFCSAL